MTCKRCNSSLEPIVSKEIDEEGMNFAFCANRECEEYFRWIILEPIICPHQKDALDIDTKCMKHDD